MINEQEFLLIVSETKADIEPFIEVASENYGFRKLLVKHLLNNSAINVYYHSYMILSEVIKSNPTEFYCFWGDFVLLLNHENSYHRNYGMDLLANLTAVDEENRFDSVINDYYKQLDDEKISTIKYCICYSTIILKNKKHLIKIVVPKILDSLRVSTHTEKHQNFLISEFIKLLNTISCRLADVAGVIDFLELVMENTKSAKVKKEIKKILSKKKSTVM